MWNLICVEWIDICGHSLSFLLIIISPSSSLSPPPSPLPLVQIGSVLFNATAGPSRPNLHYLGVLRGETVGEKEWMSQLYQIVGNANVSTSDRRNYQTLRERWKKLMDSKRRRWGGEEGTGNQLHTDVPMEGSPECVVVLVAVGRECWWWRPTCPPLTTSRWRRNTAGRP